MAQPGLQLPTISELTSLRNYQQQEIRISISSQNLTKPHQDPLHGSRKDYIKTAIPLYEASIKGDWKTAKEILDKRPELARYSITGNNETALHVAASAESTKQVEEFIGNLVNYMRKEDLELRDNSNNTPLCTVAASGNVKLVKIMVEKNRTLVTVPGSREMLPLYMAALYRKYEVVKYLYEKSDKLRDDCWTLQDRNWLLLKCVETDMFDIALKIVKDCPELASSGGALGALAKKTNVSAATESNIIMRTIKRVFRVIFSKVGAHEKENTALELLRIIWQNISEKPMVVIDHIIRGPPDQDEKPPSDREGQTLQMINLVSENFVKIHKTNEPAAATTSVDLKRGIRENKYSSQILFIAAEAGNTRFIIELIRLYPDLILKVNDNNQTIFHTAAEHRHMDIYNLLYEIGSKKEQINLLKDANDNNMLHLIGKCAKKKRHEDVSGAAFEMQRELLWFKEVEQMIPVAYQEERNKDGLKPHELFTKEHKDLVKEGEEWMKWTASQCMVVAALIATIVFAAAFTVPGGYNQNDGIPIFYREAVFTVFVVADAISLFSSSASIIMFLSILTSRYAERDFLESIPKKLLLGLTTLFLSITTMMIAFSVSFFVLYRNYLKWIPFLVAMFATMPVLLFATLQFPLLKDIYRSTYGSRYLFRPKKRALYYEDSMSNHWWFPFTIPFISRFTSKILKML